MLSSFDKRMKIKMKTSNQSLAITTDIKPSRHPFTSNEMQTIASETAEALDNNNGKYTKRVNFTLKSLDKD
jgi:hypothetical protein